MTAEIDRLGLREFTKKLDTEGYVAIPREATGMTPEFIDRVRETVLDLR